MRTDAKKTVALENALKKITAKTSYEKWIGYQDTIEEYFALFLEEVAPRKWTAAHSLLLTIAKQEDTIASQKRFFNSKAYSYNQQLETFPSSFIAQAMSKQAVWLFSLDENEKKWVASDWRNE